MMSAQPESHRRPPLAEVRPAPTPSSTGFAPVSSRRGALASQPALDLPPEFDDDELTEPGATALREAAARQAKR